MVYSTETPTDVKLLPLPEEEFQKGRVKELQAFDDFRVRIMPVLGPLPAIFGLQIATYILLDVSGKPLVDCAEIKFRRKLYQTLERGLSEREGRLRLRARSAGDAEGEGDGEGGAPGGGGGGGGGAGIQQQGKLPVNQDDIGLIFDDINHGRSSLPPYGILAKANMIRWDGALDVREDNLVVMSTQDAARHERECLVGGKAVRDVWGEEAVEHIRKKSEEIRRILLYRRR